MTEEPYRWIEAIENRREYIENQLAAGSPIVAMSCTDGILFVTVSHEQQKIFEIYDRIGMGTIGHPGDIERLRMAAIEVASAEGFNRSANDVSLRRMAAYSLSPMLKNAFEQIYGPPFLARMLFAEVGRDNETDLLLRMDYDGAFQSNGKGKLGGRDCFLCVSGKQYSEKKMTEYLRKKYTKQTASVDALPFAVDAWTVGHLTLSNDEGDLPSAEVIAAHREEQLEAGSVEAVLLDRRATSNVTYRPVAA